MTLHPDRDLNAGEVYEVQLLGLAPTGTADSDLRGASDAIEKLAEVMRQAKMHVTVATRREDAVSVAFLKSFRRFSYDYLSYKENTPLPPS